MTSTIGSRRSPRSIETLCNDIQIPYLTTEQTAALISLCQCTGWSADTISNKFKEETGFAIGAELVWNYSRMWILGRKQENPEKLTSAEWDVMQVLLKKFGVEIERPQRALSQTPKPDTVKFTEQWCAKDPQISPLFPGYTTMVREDSKEWLYYNDDSDKNSFGLLTHFEENALSKFSSEMLFILRKTLRKWYKAMSHLLSQDPGLRPIKKAQHVHLIMQYMKIFQFRYEYVFGKFDPGKPSWAFGEIRKDIVFVKSTGYGMKVVFGIMMADRMQVIEMKRARDRHCLGFIPLEIKELTRYDSKECPICSDTMGELSPDGTMEMPVRLVACCGQVLGKQCLKIWLLEFDKGRFRNSCPACRFEFDAHFLMMLFGEKEFGERKLREERKYMDARRRVEAEIELMSPSPDFNEMRGPMRSQQEQDAFLQQQLEGGDGIGEEDLMDFEDGGEDNFEMEG